MLTKEQRDILHGEGTEAPFSSPMLNEHRSGRFVCAGCGADLFRSSDKFDSGSGWPSFCRAVEGSLETKLDTTLGLPRVEYHCARCGGHQGHVFGDGPEPTGFRFCNNGATLTFIPDSED